MLFLKWSMEKACEASCCAYGVWEKDVTFASSHISRASDFWVVICHTKKFRPRRLRATCLLAYPAYHHHNNSVVDHRANNIGVYKYSIIVLFLRLPRLN